MAIPNPTLQRLFREHFPGTAPMQVAQADRDTLATQIRRRLAGMKHLDSERSHGYIDPRIKDHFVCSFTITEPTGRYGSTKSFILKLNERGQLTIDQWHIEALVSSLDEIVAFVTACQEVVERKAVQQQKRQKVRDLKAQAIVARVKTIAKEDKFDFYTQSDSQKLTLYIRLSDKDSVELRIPFNKFEEVLPHLRASVQSVRELYARGIKFKIGQFSPSGWQSQRWIQHETL